MRPTVVAALVLLAAACSSSPGSGDTPAALPDAAEALQRAADTMAGLDSYHAEATTDGGDLRTVEFAAPDRYHLVYDVEGAPSEYIVVAGASYDRTCQSLDTDCSDWREAALTGARQDLTVDAIWLLDALAAIADPAPAERDGDLVLVSGFVNHLRAFYDSRLDAPNADLDEIDRLLERDEHVIAYYDTQPAEIDVWLSPEDFRVHRIRIDILPHDDPTAPNREDDARVIEVRYSRFDDVTIEAPD